MLGEAAGRVHRPAALLFAERLCRNRWARGVETSAVAPRAVLPNGRMPARPDTAGTEACATTRGFDDSPRSQNRSESPHRGTRSHQNDPAVLCLFMAIIRFGCGGGRAGISVPNFWILFCSAVTMQFTAEFALSDCAPTVRVGAQSCSARSPQSTCWAAPSSGRRKTTPLRRQMHHHSSEGVAEGGGDALVAFLAGADVGGVVHHLQLPLFFPFLGLACHRRSTNKEPQNSVLFAHLVDNLFIKIFTGAARS